MNSRERGKARLLNNDGLKVRVSEEPLVPGCSQVS
jgi:hypothetical protein